ncbi:ankyrin repeat-containing domain protein [Aspergillus granulosus]|uniref:Ankyrin repeat-containing domain protein n=1 Tax=Aspergillus granulosus TaxID=176169 RepID=A0ABR4GZ37_9EURO
MRAGKGMTPLLIASRHGFLSIVKVLKEARDESNWDEAENSGPMRLLQSTSIMEAASMGNQMVMQQGHSACICSHTQPCNADIQVLLDNGACIHGAIEPNPLNFTLGRVRIETTLLNKAVALGHDRVVKVLLRYDVHALNHEMGNAISRGYTAGVEVLLTKYQHRPSEPWSPLGVASRSGHVDIVRLFIGKGFDEEEALFTATRYGHAEIVELLLECGTDLNLPQLPPKPSSTSTPHWKHPNPQIFIALWSAH